MSFSMSSTLSTLVLSSTARHPVAQVGGPAFQLPQPGLRTAALSWPVRESLKGPSPPGSHPFLPEAVCQLLCPKRRGIFVLHLSCSPRGQILPQRGTCENSLEQGCVTGTPKLGNSDNVPRCLLGVLHSAKRQRIPYA